MSRLKQNSNIDSLIENIKVIAKSQCSLSEQDLIDLNEALENLHVLRRKKGRTNEQFLTEIAKAIGLLTKFFVQK